MRTPSLHNLKFLSFRGLVAFVHALALLAMPAATPPVLAQQDDVSVERLNPWDMPCPTQVDMVQCRYGFIWVAAQGLWRYDGNTFRRITPDPSGDPIPEPRSWHSLVGGKHGVLLLFGLARECVLYDISTNRATVTVPSTSDEDSAYVIRVSCAVEDSRGRFLLGTTKGTLYRLDPKSSGCEKVFSTDCLVSGKSPSSIRDVLEDESGRIWIGTRCGVFQLAQDLSQFEHYTSRGDHSRRIPSDDIRALTQGHDGRIWVLTTTGELGWIDPRTGTVTVCPPAPRNHDIPNRGQIIADLKGDVWVPQGYLGGIMRWDSRRHQWLAYLTSESDPRLLGGIQTTCVTLDGSGNVWVGTNGDGIYRFTRTARRFFSCTPRSDFPSGLSSANVLSLWKDRGGTLWVGTTADGLNYLRPGSNRFVSLRHIAADSSGLPSNWIGCIREGEDNDIWLGMVGGGGICVFNRNTGSFTRRPSQRNTLKNLGSDTVTALYRDRSGTMWVGHYTGVDRYDKDAGTFRPIIRWPVETLGLAGTVAHMTEDDAGNLWLATAGHGLGRLTIETGEARWYRHDPKDPRSLPSNSIWHVYFDEARRAVWVPAQRGLVARYDDATDSFISYCFSDSFLTPATLTLQDRQSLSVSPPSWIGSDAAGNLWIAVGGSVVRFHPDSGTSRWFGRSDGIAVVEARRNACLKTEDGTIYVGGSGGLSWFHPDRMPGNHIPPKVVLTEFAIFGRPVQLPPVGIPDIRLSHRENTFSLEVAALEFTNPTRNQFMYKLDGSGDWVHMGTDRRLRFANVRPGEYTLRVRASNNDGVWNNAGISIPISITPPYWETTWFRAFVLLVVAGSVGALFRYRQSRMQATEKLRLRIADDLHDDIGSELGAIALESDLIARRLSSEPEQQRRLSEVGRAVRRSADKLRDVVWIVNPEEENLTDLIARMKVAGRSMLSGIVVSFNTPIPQRDLPLNMEIRRNILLMYKEILHNIVRHARATSVSITIEEGDGELHICVRDNGIGFDRTASSDGRGLKSLTGRAGQMKGTLTIETAPGRGTTVCFRGQITHLKD